MCKGEINQHFTQGKIPTLEEYIEKSKQKTAELFKAALVSLAKIKNIENSKVEDFAINFGIAFQIRDDLINILETDMSKPTFSDIHNKIYNAPVIFLNKNISTLTEDELFKELQTKEIKEKTIELIKKYATLAIASLDFIKDNQYKQELTNLCESLYKVI